jgi:hypothetical protein
VLESLAQRIPRDQVERGSVERLLETTCRDRPKFFADAFIRTVAFAGWCENSDSDNCKLQIRVKQPVPYRTASGSDRMPPLNSLQNRER